jgi:hypothetical protein
MRIIAFLVGLVTTLLLGALTAKVLQYVQFPSYIEDENIRKVFIKDPQQGGDSILGILEQVLAFFSLWVEGGGIVIVGWLAFKLGSKWQAWQHVVRVPDTLETKTALENLHVRSGVSSYLLSRFLIGTLYNVLCGFAGVVVGKGIEHLT